MTQVQHAGRRHNSARTNNIVVSNDAVYSFFGVDSFHVHKVDFDGFLAWDIPLVQLHLSQIFARAFIQWDWGNCLLVGKYGEEGNLYNGRFAWIEIVSTDDGEIIDIIDAYPGNFPVWGELNNCRMIQNRDKVWIIPPGNRGGEFPHSLWSVGTRLTHKKNKRLRVLMQPLDDSVMSICRHFQLFIAIICSKVYHDGFVCCLRAQFTSPV